MKKFSHFNNGLRKMHGIYFKNGIEKKKKEERKKKISR
jgi:hypothetical protein